MTLRRVDQAGRVNIPSELCDTFGIKKDDLVEITRTNEHILIKKYQPEFVCAITGKITDNGKTIGNSFISEEGIKMILNFIDEKK
ncbi:AbrB/MazE/SpoVT family DNA-binding domain-containing protein [Gottfriedia solisilvae]|uniref:AbrB/MazE/SpoVT family DNA-binding domain-containing protein n=1 Tax=Gottfriedia solisilvae TaxID=1516104 RepID=UPI003D2F038D